MHRLNWRIPIESPPEIEWYDLARHMHGSESYRLYDLWCVHLYRYHGEMVINNIRIPIRPGSASIVPANTYFTHVWPGKQHVHISIHFRVRSNSTEQTVPVIQDLGEAFEAEWEELLAVRRQGHHSERPMQAKVWSLLWRLSLPHGQGPRASNVHPSLQRAQELINEHLTESIEVARLAEEVGLSHNHLIRLFRATHGVTIQGYIRARRAERARYLLTHTSRPIKAIAHAVGMADVQTLNKTLRKVYGKSPSAIRESRG